MQKLRVENQCVPDKGQGIVWSFAELEVGWFSWRVGCLWPLVRHFIAMNSEDTACCSDGQSGSKHLLRPRGLSCTSGGVQNKVGACP